MNWTVSRRIAAGFAQVLALLAIIAGLGALGISRTSSAYDEALISERGRIAPATQAWSDWRRARGDYNRLIISEDSLSRARADSLVRDAQAAIARLRDSSTTTDDRLLWGSVLASITEWHGVARNAAALATSGRQAEAVALVDGQLATQVEETAGLIQGGVERIRSRSDDLVAASRRTAANMRFAIMLGGVLAFLAGLIAAVLLNRAVSGPLRETTGVLASSAAEILAATTQQAMGASESSASVTQTVSAVEEVTQTAQQAAERARAVAESSRRAAEIGNTGLRAVQDSVEGMGAVRQQVDAIAKSILSLAEQAQTIGEIIATVNDIAEQTNLLALNAAVEAARAGEQGRGFAVVAGEVKNLAQQSKKATVQVRQILGDIQRATSSAVLNTEQGTQQVNVTGKQVTEAGETIRSLAEAVREAAQAAAQIGASAGQQALGMSQIREAMAKVHEVTHQNLASTKQAETAARDLNAVGLKLLTLVGGEAGRPAHRRG